MSDSTLVPDGFYPAPCSLFSMIQSSRWPCCAANLSGSWPCVIVPGSGILAPAISTGNGSTCDTRQNAQYRQHMLQKCHGIVGSHIATKCLQFRDHLQCQVPPSFQLVCLVNWIVAHVSFFHFPESSFFVSSLLPVLCDSLPFSLLLSSSVSVSHLILLSTDHLSSYLVFSPLPLLFSLFLRLISLTTLSSYRLFSVLLSSPLLLVCPLLSSALLCSLVTFSPATSKHRSSLAYLRSSELFLSMSPLRTDDGNCCALMVAS